MLTQLFVATQNPGKQLEFNAILNGVVSDVVFPDDTYLEPEETGSTFAENAFIKANFSTRRPVLADDSGLEVAALDGKPGVHSKRFFPGSYEEKNQALLKLLEGAADRSAQFVTVMCLIMPNEEPRYFEGIVRGSIAEAPRGTNGFGYDPVFIPEGSTKTLAELSTAEKNTISHRALALAKVVLYLQERF